MRGYSVFGLRIHSTQPLPGAEALGDSGAPDVEVEIGTFPGWLEREAFPSRNVVYASPDTNATGRPLLTVARMRGGTFFWLQYADGTEFVVNRKGTRVWTRWPPPWTLEDVATYLLGSVLAFVLRLRGTTCLHASAVVIGAGAVALVGPSGAGKSTLAASFARRGHRVISDDVLALTPCDGTFLVQPGLAQIRLWPEAVRALYDSADALPRLTPTWDKRFLDLNHDGRSFHNEPLSLLAIYLLDEREPHPTLPRVQAVSRVAAVLGLLANTHSNYLLDSTMRAEEFECLGRLVEFVPVRRLVLYDETSLLSRVCDTITEDARALQHASARPATLPAHVGSSE